MNKPLPKLIQSLIVAGISLFIAGLVLSGKISWYIHQRFLFLMILAILCLGTMAALTLQKFLKTPAAALQHHTQVNLSEVFILAIPLLIGFFIPARPLSASAVDTRGVSYSAPGSLPNSQPEGTFALQPDERNILDWLRAYNTGSKVNAPAGEKANVVGFIYHDKDNFPAQNYFMVGRFVITCCAADAFPIGIPVIWENAAQLKEDTWVQVQGTVESVKVNDITVPLIRAEVVTIVESPDQPYLFP